MSKRQTEKRAFIDKCSDAGARLVPNQGPKFITQKDVALAAAEHDIKDKGDVKWVYPEYRRRVIKWWPEICAAIADQTYCLRFLTTPFYEDHHDLFSRNNWQMSNDDIKRSISGCGSNKETTGALFLSGDFAEAWERVLLGNDAEKLKGRVNAIGNQLLDAHDKGALPYAAVDVARDLTAISATKVDALKALARNLMPYWPAKQEIPGDLERSRPDERSSD